MRLRSFSRQHRSLALILSLLLCASCLTDEREPGERDDSSSVGADMAYDARTPGDREDGMSDLSAAGDMATAATLDTSPSDAAMSAQSPDAHDQPHLDQIDPSQYKGVDPVAGASPVERVAPETLTFTLNHPRWVAERGVLMVSQSKGRSDTSISYRPHLYDPISAELKEVIPDLMELAGSTAQDKLAEQFAWCMRFSDASRDLCWVRARKLGETSLLIEDLFAPSPQIEANVERVSKGSGSAPLKWLADAVALPEGTIYASTLASGLDQIVRLKRGEVAWEIALSGTEAMAHPMALARSPDASTLYFTTRGEQDDQGALWSAKVDARGELLAPEVLVEGIAIPDALEVDAAGNLYVGSYRSILVYTEQGVLWGELSVEEVRPQDKSLRITGLAFGGDKGETLYVTYGKKFKHFGIDKGHHGGALFQVQMPIPGSWRAQGAL